MDTRDIHTLPEGWVEGRDVACLREGVIRYLGIFLGAPKKVAEEWLKRTTKKIVDKADLWRERNLPVTREGRCIALRNSILAQAWYLVENQIPPNVEEMMNTWRDEVWSFFSGKKGGLNPTKLTKADVPGGVS